MKILEATGSQSVLYDLWPTAVVSFCGLFDNNKYICICTYTYTYIYMKHWK